MNTNTRVTPCVDILGSQGTISIPIPYTPSNEINELRGFEVSQLVEEGLFDFNEAYGMDYRTSKESWAENIRNIKNKVFARTDRLLALGTIVLEILTDGFQQYTGPDFFGWLLTTWLPRFLSVLPNFGLYDQCMWLKRSFLSPTFDLMLSSMNAPQTSLDMQSMICRLLKFILTDPKDAIARMCKATERIEL